MSDDEKQWPPKAPSQAELPARLNRVTRGGGARDQIEVSIEVVTPIFGGSAAPRKVDRGDVIRAASIRGHLRFWWRALNAHEREYDNAPKRLYEDEVALWGGATGQDGGGRCPVEVRVDVKRSTDIVDTPPSMRDIDGYALFPARAEANGAPAGERRAKGTQFVLTLDAPAETSPAIRDALRAWLLFGGYGGRTRRGLGSLTVLEDRDAWLPRAGGIAAFEPLFGRKIFAEGEHAPVQTPVLAGARCWFGPTPMDAEVAWTTALSWLREFRQGTAGTIRAREPHHDPKRPSISNWPEADKVRCLRAPPRNLTWAHPPRHNGVPAWPRAALGLPIIGQFQQFSREIENGKNKRWDRCSPPKAEPEPYKIVWHDGENLHDRLASPLIIKPLPLANGRFLPLALWLTRANPDGVVVLEDQVERSRAPFDRLVAPGDTPQFKALDGHDSIRDAFFGWLETHLVERSAAARASNKRDNRKNLRGRGRR